MVFGVLALFPDINQQEAIAAVKSGFDVVKAGFADPLLRVFDNLQETSGMLVRHEDSVPGLF